MRWIKMLKAVTELSKLAWGFSMLVLKRQMGAREECPHLTMNQRAEMTE